ASSPYTPTSLARLFVVGRGYLHVSARMCAALGDCATNSAQSPTLADCLTSSARLPSVPSIVTFSSRRFSAFLCSRIDAAPCLSGSVSALSRTSVNDPLDSLWNTLYAENGGFVSF